MKCGLLGEHLPHSYSPQIHGRLGTYNYELFEKTPQELEDFLCSDTFDGLNVTIPYKKAVIPYCHTLSETAQRLGAVNTIVRRPDGTLVGHNTDYFGFQTMVGESGLSVSGKKVLVLGSGGASNTAVAVMEDMGAIPVVISRSGKNNYTNLSRHADAAVIVNCTPVGMYPNTDSAPLDISAFPQLEGVLDVVYNPARTRLLQDAEGRGIIAMNGLLMLVAQAKESAEWFTGQAIDSTVIAGIHRTLRLQMENIVLIGMPGCGKTTVGKLLAQMTGKVFVDADIYLEETYGRTIPEIFKTKGEESFRRMETAVLSQLGKRSGLILATGGGCVTRPENYGLLHQNGTIFCLSRDLKALPTEGRPISQSTKLEELYCIRKPMYQRFSDYNIANDGQPQDAAEQILKLWEERA